MTYLSLVPCPLSLVPCPSLTARDKGQGTRDKGLSQVVATVNAVPTAHAVRLAAIVAGRCVAWQRLGAAATVRLADLVDLVALGAGDLARHAPPLQVRLDLPRREVTVLDVLREVDLDQLVQPAVLRR